MIQIHAPQEEEEERAAKIQQQSYVNLMANIVKIDMKVVDAKSNARRDSTQLL